MATALLALERDSAPIATELCAEEFAPVPIAIA